MAAAAPAPFDTDCVAAAARLRHTPSGRVVCVATTHVFWRWQMPDVQASQARAAVALGASLCRPGDALVVAGDFNSLPGSAPLAAAVREGGGLCSLHEAYEAATAGRDCGRWTTYTPDFRGWIDHVLWRPRELSLEAVALLPGEDDLCKEPGLPSTAHPSDHLPLLARFAWGQQDR
eukprot:m51a1_g12473 hypothetical protein (176) ;mRNA; f:83-777